jgi:hypothetical protein
VLIYCYKNPLVCYVRYFHGGEDVDCGHLGCDAV